MKGIRFLNNSQEPDLIKVDQTRHVRSFMTYLDETVRKEHWEKAISCKP